MADLESVLDDVAAEGDSLDALVAAAPTAAWARPTPAPGWTVAHQIAHLAWTDDVACISATRPDAFADVVTSAWRDPAGFVDAAAEAGAGDEPAELLARWRRGRRVLLEALAGVEPGRKLAWFGPPMSVMSMATARLMETWAHGQDIADALGVTRLPTARLRHVAYLGVRTRDFAFSVHQLTPPASPFRIELRAADGSLWTWGPQGAEQRVSGPAVDFCLLVTQRRHRDDLAVSAVGAEAQRWLTIAQAFAGAPGAGRHRSGSPGRAGA